MSDENKKVKTLKTISASPISIDKENRTMEIIMTTPDVDRDGDVIHPEGLDIKNYLKNPVVLWNHDSWKQPIAVAESVMIDAGGMKASIRFAKSTFAQEVFDLYADGIMNSWSLGFIPGDMKRIEQDKPGWDINTAEVLEVSAVPIPANPNCVTRSLSPRMSKALGLKKTETEIIEIENAKIMELNGKATIEMPIDREKFRKGCFKRSLDTRVATGKVKLYEIKGDIVGDSIEGAETDAGLTISFDFTGDRDLLLKKGFDLWCEEVIEGKEYKIADIKVKELGELNPAPTEEEKPSPSRNLDNELNLAKAKLRMATI